MEKPNPDQQKLDGFCSLTDFQDYSIPGLFLHENLSKTTDYLKEEIAGEGSAGCVFKAKSLHDNTTVALKVIKSHKSITQSSQIIGPPNIDKSVFREITILNSLKHKNVINLIQVVIDPETNKLSLALEYCPYSLAAIIDDKSYSIDIKQIKCVLKQLFSGLRYIHQNYIIHRDIKPSNCLITSDGTLKIIDFGLGCRYSERSRATTPSVVTLHYKAPEILLEYPEYGSGIDMWSAGCIMAELYLHEPLFQGESEINQLNVIMNTLGPPTKFVWPNFVNCKHHRNINTSLKQNNFLEKIFSNLEGTSAMEILKGLLLYDPDKRLTAVECFEHPWLCQSPYPGKDIKIPEGLKA